eukprot:scaffold174848_cov30-Tisochrysis_lutea.AAC.3
MPPPTLLPPTGGVHRKVCEACALGLWLACASMQPQVETGVGAETGAHNDETKSEYARLLHKLLSIKIALRASRGSAGLGKGGGWACRHHACAPHPRALMVP